MLLLTPPDRLDQRVEAELDRILPRGGTVVLLGGTSALSAAVETRLTALGYTVERLGGANRLESAVRIARDVLGDPDTLLLATAITSPDALAGSASGRAGTAGLLTAGDNMPARTYAYLDSHPPCHAVCAGRSCQPGGA